MSKKRTKKQKMKAEARREVTIHEHGYSYANVQNSEPTSKPTLLSIASAKNEKDHSYVFQETKQTALVTTGIIVGQIILAVLIRTNIVHLPF